MRSRAFERHSNCTRSPDSCNFERLKNSRVPVFPKLHSKSCYYLYTNISISEELLNLSLIFRLVGNSILQVLFSVNSVYICMHSVSIHPRQVGMCDFCV